MLIRRWYTHAIGIMDYIQLVIYHGLEQTYLDPQLPLTCNRIEHLKYLITSLAFSKAALIVQTEIIQSDRNRALTQEDLKLITSAFLTKTDAVYKLHATLGHLPYSRMERMILKGIMKGYTFDVNLIKKMMKVKCDIYMREKITDSSCTKERCFTQTSLGTLSAVTSLVLFNRGQYIEISTCLRSWILHLNLYSMTIYKIKMKLVIKSPCFSTPTSLH